MNRILSQAVDRFGIYKKNKLKSPVSQFVKLLPNEASSITVLGMQYEDKIPDLERIKQSEVDSYELGSFHFNSRIQDNGKANKICVGQYYLSTSSSTIDVIIVHGWKSSSLKSAKSMLLEPLMNKGYNLYFMELPHHMSRKSIESGFSGEFMISANVNRTIASVQQAVIDACDIVSWSKSKGHKTIVIGLSLGGLVTNLLGCTVPHIDALISIMYASNLAQLIWKSSVAKHIKKDFQDNGFTLDELNHAWNCINPLLLKPKVNKDKIFLISGEYDLFITKEDSDGLCLAWDNPERKVIPCGHSGLNICTKIISEDICRFIEKSI